MVTTLPSFVVGPSLPPAMSSTVSGVLGLLRGVLASSDSNFLTGVIENGISECMIKGVIGFKQTGY